MDKTVDSILRRIEERGYRLALLMSGMSLTIEALRSGSGERFIVHGGWNRPLATALELARMVGVACDDIVAGQTRRAFPLDDPEVDEPGHRLSVLER